MLKLLIAVAAVSATLGLGLSAAAAPTPTIPVPLPPAASGLPDVTAQMAALGPGETELLAVRAAGSDKWYRPQDTDATIIAPGVVAGSFKPTAVGRATQALHRVHASEYVGFGCTTKTYVPFWVAAGVIEGSIDFFLCYNVAHTNADVCVKNSANYSCTAHALNGHDGNGDWTGWSNAWVCNDYNQKGWATNSTNQYIAIDGRSSLWGASSQYVSLYC
jgi:hypothetical protein